MGKSMINQSTITTTSTGFKGDDGGVEFSRVGEELIYVKVLNDERTSCPDINLTVNEFDDLIETMIAFREALKMNEKIPEKDFVVSEEEAEAIIAKTFKHEEF